MNAYRAFLFWFDNLLRQENAAKLTINLLVVLPFICSVFFACCWYGVGVHRLIELLESEEGIPLFAQLGAIVYVNLQEDEILQRLRGLIRFLMNETHRTVGTNPKLESRLQKAVIHLVKYKLKEEVKYPGGKSE